MTDRIPLAFPYDYLTITTYEFGGIMRKRIKISMATVSSIPRKPTYKHRETDVIAVLEIPDRWKYLGNYDLGVYMKRSIIDWEESKKEPGR